MCDMNMLGEFNNSITLDYNLKNDLAHWSFDIWHELDFNGVHRLIY